MRSFGWVLSLIGAALGLYALFMDIGVDVGDGSRVVNIGLMSMQQNYIIIAGVLFVAGVIVSRVGGKNVKLEPTDFLQSDRIIPSEFVIELDGIAELNFKKIDEFSLMLLSKHRNSSPSDILLMESPRLDNICKNLPAHLRKSFRQSLERRIRANN